MTLSQQFMDSVLTTEIDPEDHTMSVIRQYYGMEAVAQFGSQTPTEAYRNNADDERSES
jgi:hypothetical protein